MQRMGQWLVVAAMLGFGFAMAQSEPTLKQVYEAAQAGRLEQAQVMMQQVLVAHPGSAKAHFVQAELFARQGKLSPARDALATAEKLAPGLPFAKPEAVKALRAQLAGKTSAATTSGPSPMPARMSAPAAPSSSSSFPWGPALALGGGAIALVIFLTRKKPAPAYAPQAPYPNQENNFQGGLSGPQNFGAPNNMGGGMMAPGYGQGQPAGSGLGGRLMGGLATGLAVGAGVMAAQAIGKSLMGNEAAPTRPAEGAANNGYEPLAGNNDLGGQDFGVNDTSSWDDNNAIASSGDGGGDWDS